LLSLSALPACGERGTNEEGGEGGAARTIVVYVALDRPYAEPVIAAFTKATGLQVDAQYDSESTKTTGLYQRIVAEQAAPRCDVFWNNEILRTVQLANAGLLARYRSPSAEGIPDLFRGANDLWTGFAARARVILYNTERCGDWVPSSLADFAGPRGGADAAIAKPIFGTTAIHLCSGFDRLVNNRDGAFYRAIAESGVQVLDGNARVAAMVAEGRCAFGLTDTDDASVVLGKGSPVVAVYPSDLPLLIPNTASLIKGAPNGDGARRFIDFLLSKETERMLAGMASVQIPLHAGVALPATFPFARPTELTPGDLSWIGTDDGRRLKLLAEIFVR
jgi:iron(III) transport system substrate-binding protein